MRNLTLTHHIILKSKSIICFFFVELSPARFVKHKNLKEGKKFDQETCVLRVLTLLPSPTCLYIHEFELGFALRRLLD